MKPEQFHSALQELVADPDDDPFADDPATDLSPITTPVLCDYLLGQVIQGLIEDGKEETASMILSCHISLEVKQQRSGRSLLPTIHGPVSILKQLQERHSHFEEIGGNFVGPYNINLDEFYAVLVLVIGPKVKVEYSEYIRFQAEVVELPSDWRTELLEIVRKKGTTNQGLSKGATSYKPRIYQNLLFRSASGVEIAKALDQHKVMYFANCTARVNYGEDRINREPDFLICSNGKWGVLEVDGEPYHPPTRTVHDHERDRLFQMHGVRLVEHYDANRCYQEPRQVVLEFLDLLAKSA